MLCGKGIQEEWRITGVSSLSHLGTERFCSDPKLAPSASYEQGSEALWCLSLEESGDHLGHSSSPWVSLPQPAHGSSSSKHMHSSSREVTGYLHSGVWAPFPKPGQHLPIFFRLAKSPYFRNMTAFTALLRTWCGCEVERKRGAFLHPSVPPLMQKVWGFTHLSFHLGSDRYIPYLKFFSVAPNNLKLSMLLLKFMCIS